MVRKNPFGLGSFGFGATKKRTRRKKKTKKIKPEKRGTLYVADKEKILVRQRGKCAGKTCARDHGKKMPVNIRSHFDHIKPLALGGRDTISNIQALCANCHQKKTREDRKKIAIAKKEGKIKSTRKKKKTKRKSKRKKDPLAIKPPKIEIEKLY